MARIRTIKPEFWTDETLSECSVSARLLFIGTWNFADDAGNLERSAKQLKMKIFPSDNINIEPLLKELLIRNILIEYEVDGKKYLHIKGFAKHQVINRPSTPFYPKYDDSLRTHGVFTEDSGELSEDSLTERKGKERKGKEKEGKGSGETIVAPVKPLRPAHKVLSDEEWIATLKVNPAYTGIDIAREKAKMEAWCMTNKKEPTRKRFLNWLNRVDLPMTNSATGQVTVSKNATAVLGMIERLRKEKQDVQP